MSLQTVALMPKVTFTPGGKYPAKPSYSRHHHDGIPYTRIPDGSIHFYLDDNRRRFRMPVSSIAWVIDDDVPGLEVAPPSVQWQLATVVFKQEISIGGQRGSIGFWDAARYPEIACIETDLGFRLELPDKRVVNVALHMVATIMDAKVTAAAPQPEPRNDWPAAEVTPAQPPRRPAPRKP